MGIFAFLVHEHETYALHNRLIFWSCLYKNTVLLDCWVCFNIAKYVNNTFLHYVSYPISLLMSFCISKTLLHELGTLKLIKALLYGSDEIVIQMVFTQHLLPSVQYLQEYVPLDRLRRFFYPAIGIWLMQVSINY